MKNKIKNSTAVLLATVFVFSVGFFALRTERFYKVKADTAVETKFDYFSQSYFKNLTTNFGWNYKGSCMFIAAEMLFSYYDNCVSDTIVPEKYDKVYSAGTPFVYDEEDSPGTKDDLISVAEWQVATGQTLFDEELAEELYIYDNGAIYENDGYRFDMDDDNDYIADLSIGQYMDIVQTKVNESLHCKLLSIGDGEHVYFSEEYGCGVIEATLRDIM